MNKLFFQRCLLVLVVFTLGWSACDEIQYDKRYYQITSCADPWHVENASAQEYTANAVNWFAGNSIEIKNISLIPDGESSDDTCTGCECNTSERLEFLVLRDDIGKLDDLAIDLTLD